MSKSCLLIIILSLTMLCCTKLDESFRGDVTSGQVKEDSSNAAQLLLGVYRSMYLPFTQQLSIFPLMEFTTDEAIMPTRGGDWDDNGVWRALHEHKWLPNNDQIRQPFNHLNGTSYAATDLLRYHPTEQQAAEARFVRAWVMYLLLDFFDQVPYRDTAESLVEPARVRRGIEALQYIIDEIRAIKPLLLPITQNFRANRFAADFLLMKCYLNKHIYEHRPVLPASPSAEDMNKVIELADDIILNGNFSLSKNYFDNFAPDNSTLSNENIFVLLNQPNATPDNQSFLIWLMVLHYNQGFGCCNGGSTLSDFYDLFEARDIRRGYTYPSSGFPPNPGNRTNVGFLFGQQYDWVVDTPLNDRLGNRLNFLREVHNVETVPSNIENGGIRPLKYYPDYQSPFSPDNDFVLFRFSDVLLMKAEAIYRGGHATSAGPYGSSPLSIINYIRTHPSRNASPLTAITEQDLIDERGRELWWESWRRQDMIRFGTFLKPFQEKMYDSDPKYLLFPIPEEQVALNKYLKQNPGY
ncbi:RagB/SusD family nutrient uptake outer membrane protein [Pollutibacter soli]|uniref:RagB/SusD family nutrient uptake outer membrane protein n=1 Tax=Pollutibacter soli TaxID=3034157 RepID=UPI003013D987